MKKLCFLLAATLAGLSTSAAHAEALKGSALRAVLLFSGDTTETNLFSDPLDKIGSGKEFLYDDGVATYTANFNADGFTVRVNCDTGVSLTKCQDEPQFLMEFKDNAFVNATVTYDKGPLNAIYLPLDVLNSGDPFSNPKIFSILEVAPVPSKNANLVFSIATVPEPSSLALFGAGVLGLAGILRRRLLS